MNKVAIIYWSDTGNTKAMAEAIKEGAGSTDADVDLIEVASMTADKALTYDSIALGCPSMGDEVLEESEFEPFYKELSQKFAGKKIALFGSYGWGDGEWMRNWEADV